MRWCRLPVSALLLAAFLCLPAAAQVDPLDQDQQPQQQTPDQQQQPSLFPPQSPTAQWRPRSFGDFMRQIGEDQKTIWLSPFKMDRKELTHAAIPIALITAALIATDRKTSGALPNTPDQIEVSRDIGTVGDLYVLGAAVALPWIYGAVKHNDAALSIGSETTRALVNAAIVGYGAKYVFWRDRPEQGNGNGNFWGGGNSFPSGHAITAFAAASALAHNKRVPKWLKITAYSAATAVALSRYPAQKHWLSDIFVGATFGYFIGKQAAGVRVIP